MTARHLSLPSVRLPTTFSYISNTHLNIVLPSTDMQQTWSSFLLVCAPTPCLHSLLCICVISRVHLTLLGLITPIISDEYKSRRSSRSFLQTLSLRAKCLPQHPILHPKSIFFPLARSYPYKTTPKTIQRIHHLYISWRHIHS